MKKILLLFIIPFFLTGCFDYQELNQRAIVSGIGIDYQEDEFLVTLELLNTKKSDSEKESTEKTYYLEGSGKTISEALQSANLKVNKDPYYAHLKVMVFSEEIAKNQMDKILDYFLREPNIRSIFIPVLAVDATAKEILKTTTTENPVSSEAIQSMIENNKASDHIALDIDFEKFADALVDKRKDAVMNAIQKEEDHLILTGIAAFEGYKMKTILDKQQSATYLVLKNESEAHFIKKLCNEKEKKYITIDLYENKNTNISYKKNKIEIESDLRASIIEDDCNYDFRDPKIYPKIEELFYKTIEEEYQKLLKNIQNNKTDILGINEKNYKNERKELADWYQKEITIKINLDINKNGLIFKVTHDK